MSLKEHFRGKLLCPGVEMKKEKKIRARRARERLQFTFRFEELLEVLQHLLGRRIWRVALNGLSILVDNEFGEVPLNRIEERSTLLLLEILVERMRVLAVHVYLVKEVEIDFAILDEALNFLGIAWLLVTELIARECKDSKTCWDGKKVEI